MIAKMKDLVTDTGSSVSDYVRQALANQIKQDEIARAQYRAQLQQGWPSAGGQHTPYGLGAVTTANTQISGGTPSAESDCWQKDGDK
jgi:hypothetical protein